MIQKIILCMAFVLSTQIWAQTNLEAGSTYRLSGGSIDTTVGVRVPMGQRIRVMHIDRDIIHFELLDQNLQPLPSEGGRIFQASSYWVQRSAEPLELEEVVSSLNRTLNQGPDMSAPTPHCPGCEEALAAQAPLEPQTVAADDLGPFKNRTDIDQYFACYQRDTNLRSDYTSRYRSSIQSASQTLSEALGDGLVADEVDGLMACLIFRESALWKGGTSGTGAVGLGQFTSVARDQIKDIINYSGRDNYDERIAVQRSEHQAGRLSESQLNRNISLIETERRNYLRMSELKSIWESFPLQNRPSAGDITSNYMGNNDNHQAIVAMSTLLVRDCQIRLEQSYEITKQESLLACAGAYNMGVGGFRENAMNSQGPHTVESWVANLRSSGHPQATETANHVISIHRCVNAGDNFPPCGTQADYCRDLNRANSCQAGARPLCSGECS